MNNKLTTYKQVLNMLSRLHNDYLFFLFALLLFLPSCKKDEDKLPPVVTISSPKPSSTVDGDFGFLVEGTIADNENIKHMQIKLESVSSSNYSTYFKEIPINKGAIDFVKEVLIENEDFIAGYYNLSVTAFDGTNIGVASVRIYVNYEPIKFLGCLSAIEYNNQTVVNWFNPDNGIDSLYGQASVSFGGLAVNSKRKLYILAEKDQRNITAREKVVNNPVWSISNTKLSSSYQYKSLYTFNNLIYALSYNSEIEIFNRDGIRQNVISTRYRPIKMAKTSNKIYTIEQASTNQYYMGEYNEIGVLLNHIFLNFYPVGIEGQKSGDVYVLGNFNNLGKLMEYKSKASAFNELQNFNYELSSSCYCDGKLYFNSISGSFYEFSIGFNNGIQRASGVYSDLMKCHESTKQLYYNHSSQGNWGIIDVRNNAKIYQGNYASKVLGIEFLYSR